MVVGRIPKFPDYGCGGAAGMSATSFPAGDIFTRIPQPQTLKAWHPYHECVGILFRFQNSDIADEDDELSEWRIYWIAGLSLLRTIGHVLAKVDAHSSPMHEKVVRVFWEELKKDRISSSIFWDFIDEERNNLLKTYTFGAKYAPDGIGYAVQFGDGSDAFSLFRHAVYWWRHKLEIIEEQIEKG